MNQALIEQEMLIGKLYLELYSINASAATVLRGPKCIDLVQVWKYVILRILINLIIMTKQRD